MQQQLPAAAPIPSAAATPAANTPTPQQKQKPAVAPKNGLALIIRDHELIKIFFGKIDRARHVNQKKQILDEQLQILICGQMFVEEAIVYPLARKRLQNSEQHLQLIERLAYENHETRHLLHHLEKTETKNVNTQSDSNYLPVLKRLKEVVLQHLDFTELILLPAIHEAIVATAPSAEAELAKLEDVLVAAKVIAPTRAHPASVLQTPASIIEHFALAHVDRLRDLSKPMPQ